VPHKKVANGKRQRIFATEITENGNDENIVSATVNGKNTEDDKGINIGEE